MLLNRHQVYDSVDGPSGLLDRLLTKRPLVFFTANDVFQLRSGEDGAGGFDAVGTARESAPLVLRDLQSYDEMALSSLIGVSTPTAFINTGSRAAAGRASDPYCSVDPQILFLDLVPPILSFAI